MTTATVSAAATFPEWTPAVAAPAPAGQLCWARSAGICSFAHAGLAPKSLGTRCSGFTRTDGVMQLTPSSRLSKTPELLAPYNVASPLWGAKTVVLYPRAHRTEESSGSPEAHEFVSILGAAWLLMGQSTFTQTRSVQGQTAECCASGSQEPRPAQSVTLVDVNRRHRPNTMAARSTHRGLMTIGSG